MQVSFEPVDERRSALGIDRRRVEIISAGTDLDSGSTI